MISHTFDLTVSLTFESVNALGHISTILGVSPTSYINKEKPKFSFVKSDKYVWVYSKKYRDYDGSVAVHIDDFLADIPDYSSKIRIACQYANCALRISVVTNWAQSGFSLGTKELEIIHRLDIPLEISVFSWGNCVDE